LHFLLDLFAVAPRLRCCFIQRLQPCIFSCPSRHGAVDLISDLSLHVLLTAAAALLLLLQFLHALLHLSPITPRLCCSLEELLTMLFFCSVPLIAILSSSLKDYGWIKALCSTLLSCTIHVPFSSGFCLCCQLSVSKVLTSGITNGRGSALCTGAAARFPAGQLRPWQMLRSTSPSSFQFRRLYCTLIPQKIV
jgi:hypothetical protein